MNKIRIALFLGGLAGGLFMSPYVPAIAILALSLLFRAWEAILLGLLMDLMWLPPGHPPFFTVGAIAVVWLMEPIRKEFLT
jgi:hypothetical protein